MLSIRANSESLSGKMLRISQAMQQLQPKVKRKTVFELKVSKHYENLPMQYTEIFFCCKN